MSCYFCDGSTYKTLSSLCEELGHYNGSASIGLDFGNKPTLTMELSKYVPVDIECCDSQGSIDVEMSLTGYLHGIKYCPHCGAEVVTD